jgi:hypothetical protein
MVKNLLHCETGFGVYRSTQLSHIPFFLLLYLLVGPSIACFQTSNIVNSYLFAHQLGVATKLGCEAAIHTTRTFVNNDHLCLVICTTSFESHTFTFFMNL